MSIGAAEIIVVLLVALVIVGPKDLPRVARWLGRAVQTLRGLIAEIKRETGLDAMESELRTVQRELGDAAQAADLRKELNGDVQQVRRELDQALAQDHTAPTQKDGPVEGGKEQ